MDETVAVFIASKHSGPTLRRVLWLVSRADAMKICSDPRTAGRNSMLCWIEDYGVEGKDFRFVKDTGATDAVLKELDITILASA